MERESERRKNGLMDGERGGDSHTDAKTLDIGILDFFFFN